MSAECIFCRIARGEIPATRLYEDADTLAFLDIGPVTRGHALIIPKAHHDPITDVPPALLQKVIVTVQKVARAQMEGLKAQGVNVTQANGRLAGQVVPHVHFHSIPRFEHDGRNFNWEPGEYVNAEEMNEVAQRIRGAMS